MDDNIKEADGMDIIMWPDGFFCYREELQEFGHRSDDYRIIPLDSAEWHLLTGE